MEPECLILDVRGMKKFAENICLLSNGLIIECEYLKRNDCG